MDGASPGITDHQGESPEQDIDVPTAAPPRREHVAADYHKESHKLRTFMILVVILVVAVAVGGSYWYAKHHQEQKQAQAAQAALAAQPKISSQIDSSTKSYTSPNFYLTFSYPADWTITDTGGGQMTVVSPPIELKSATGQMVTGQIKSLFLNTTTNLSGFSQGNAIAVLASELINYSKPTSDQRAATYISFLQYASTAGSGLDAIYITSDNGYQLGQAIPLVDVSKEDPVISISFVQCSNDSCSGKTTPLTISVSSWNDSKFSDPLKNMLKSLAIT